ncbi:integrase catalytic domain-containing protein [Trichonephila clavata]|uniref:Integrase catalytic domain-containing protein n=1 Tax=Trichonephila clavata TaxID=2740835 RepID=A0A8X6G9W6_TRICU|nr:integrase catalytic domain-containing protein [Trichonephila clavata]
MARGCFNLRGWESNVPGRYISRSSSLTSLLGLLWDLDKDTLKCNLNYSGEGENKIKKGPLSELRLGEIVLIGDHIKKRMHWPLAKVMRLIPGTDDKIRTVELKTRTGTMLRPIQRVYPLEIQSKENPMILMIVHLLILFLHL